MNPRNESHIKSLYNRDGFHISAEPVVPADVVERAGAGMDAIRRGEYDTGRPPEHSMWKPGDNPHSLCKIEQPQFASQGVMELVSHPALGELAAALTGAKMVQVWWVQLLQKPSTPAESEAPTNIGMHQDRQYWGAWEEGSELFTAWVAISNVTLDSGPMFFVRGSHKWGLQEAGNFFEQDVEGQRGRMTLHEGQVWEEVPAILPPGGVSFHTCLTIHGSGPNRSGHPRRSFAIHMRTERSRPLNNQREGLTRYIDDTTLCPVIYQRD